MIDILCFWRIETLTQPAKRVNGWALFVSALTLLAMMGFQRAAAQTVAGGALLGQPVVVSQDGAALLKESAVMRPTDVTKSVGSDTANTAANGAGEPDGAKRAKSDARAPTLQSQVGLTEFQLFVEQSIGRSLPIYGAKIFETGPFDPVQATQVPDSYIVGPGDELVLRIYGAFEHSDRQVVDRDGRITLPKIGPIKVAGLQFAQLESALTRGVGDVFKNFKLTVSMGRLRSIEVYMLGQARSPGRKVVSSLSTLVNALFETGGPSVRGSLRGIELRRAGKIVTRLDLYDFIAKGDNLADRPLQPGDIIYIPPVGPQVAILGSVNESAIFELPPAGGTTLQSVLALTGGVTALATPHIAQLERVDAKQQPARRVQNIALDTAGLASVLQAGDVVTIYPISPQFANAVTLKGTGDLTMRYPHREGMRVSDLVTNNNFLVPLNYWLRLNAGTMLASIDRPEVNLEYATIQRLDPVRLRTETISFHLAKALLGDPAENLVVKPGDLVRVYGANEATQDAINSVTLDAGFLVSPEGRRSVWRKGYRIKDIIPDLRWLQDEVVRQSRSTGLAVSAADGKPATVANASIPQGKLSIADLQELNFEYADVRRLDPVTLAVRLITFNLAKALAGDPDHNITLQQGDRIGLYTKREVPVPVERQTRLVRVLGEVAVPGTYQVEPGETLSDVVRKAGGFTKQAYPYGARFTRESTRLEQKRNLAAYIKNIEMEALNQPAVSLQNQSTQDIQRQEALANYRRQGIERLRTSEVSGRIALDLDENATEVVLPSLALEDGDTLEVPKQSDFVSVVGAIDIGNAMIYRPGQKVRDYLERAGLKPYADLENIAILKADGTVRTRRTVAGRQALFEWGNDANFMGQVLRPGDAILVPEKLDRQSGYTTFITAAKDWTQLIYQLGLGIAAFKSLN